MKNLLIFIVSLLCHPLVHWGQCAHQFTDHPIGEIAIHKDIVFGENTTSEGVLQILTLDIYEPITEEEEVRPAVILLHGGSFIGGNKEDGEVAWICEDLAKRGIVAISPNYRVEENPLSLISEETMVKAVIRAVEDCKASMRYLYKQMEEGNPYHVDPDAIFLGGSSAGSITTLHTVFMNDFSTLKPRYQDWVLELGLDPVTLEGNSGNPGYTGSIAGLINISGAIVSLDFLLSPADLPMLSIHNEIDYAVPYTYGFPFFIPTLPVVAGSRPIHYFRKDQGADTKLLTIQGINHVPHTAWDGSQFQPVYDNILNEILLFIGRNSACSGTVTAVEEHGLLPFYIYPNPTSNEIHFDSSLPLEDLHVSIIGRAGTEFTNVLHIHNDIAVLPKELPNGLYYLHLFSSDDKWLGTERISIVR